MQTKVLKEAKGMNNNNNNNLFSIPEIHQGGYRTCHYITAYKYKYNDSIIGDNSNNDVRD
jgi:hypothetical protein